MNVGVIILGAGNSTRMGGGKSKLLIKLAGKTVIERSVSAFYNLNFVNKIIVVTRRQDEDDFKRVLKSYKNIVFSYGGETRQKSVVNAVSCLDANTDYVIIHDGARPLVSSDSIRNAYEAALIFKASSLGVPVKDTIKIVDDAQVVASTPERSKLFSIQTPQIFEFKSYKRAMELAEKAGNDFTDDCQLIEQAGGKVKIVTGEYENIKITTPDDIAFAEKFLEQRGETV